LEAAQPPPPQRRGAARGGFRSGGVGPSGRAPRPLRGVPRVGRPADGLPQSRPADAPRRESRDGLAATFGCTRSRWTGPLPLLAGCETAPPVASGPLVGPPGARVLGSRRGHSGPRTPRRNRDCEMGAVEVRPRPPPRRGPCGPPKGRASVPNRMSSGQLSAPASVGPAPAPPRRRPAHGRRRRRSHRYARGGAGARRGRAGPAPANPEPVCPAPRFLPCKARKAGGGSRTPTPSWTVSPWQQRGGGCSPRPRPAWSAVPPSARPCVSSRGRGQTEAPSPPPPVPPDAPWRRRRQLVPPTPPHLARTRVQDGVVCAFRAGARLCDAAPVTLAKQPAAAASRHARLGLSARVGRLIPVSSSIDRL